MPGPEAFARDASELRLSRAELLEAAAISEPQLAELEGYGLVRRATAATTTRTPCSWHAPSPRLAAFGLEARHLRAFKAAADREVGLVEQVVTPQRDQRGAEAKARADEMVRELAALSVRLHAGPGEVRPGDDAR